MTEVAAVVVTALAVVSVVVLWVLLVQWAWDRAVGRWLWPWLVARRGVPTVHLVEQWSRAQALQYLRSPVHRDRCACRRYGGLDGVLTLIDDERGEMFRHGREQCSPERERVPDPVGDRRCACGGRVLPAGSSCGYAWVGGVLHRHSPDSCAKRAEDEDDDEPDEGDWW